MTITEALGELRLIEKKLEKKRMGVQTYLCGYMDPLVSRGGSSKYVQSELDAIEALMDRHVRIRLAIQDSNREQVVLIDNDGRKTSRTVADWLTWKRELVKGQRQFLALCIQRIEQFRNKHENQWHEQSQKARGMKEEDLPAPEEPKLLIHADEKGLRDQLADIDYAMERLDTALTLHNSTVQVDVD